MEGTGVDVITYAPTREEGLTISTADLGYWAGTYRLRPSNILRA